MFYVLSKIIFVLIAPSNFCLIAIGCGFLMQLRAGWRRWGRRVVVAGFAMLLIAGFSPLGKWLVLPLEERFAGARVNDGARVTHIILLGGFELATVSRARGQLAINASAERLTETLVLARRFPAAQVVFTGGWGWLFGERIDATRWVTDYLVAAGVARERIVTEGQARNTWQNAVFVNALIARQGGKCPCGFVLVTSARHMPRSVGVFRKAGFADGDRALYPYPVDYRTRGPEDAAAGYDWVYEGLEQTDLAFKEWVGLVAYWLSGRSSALWPGPRPSGDRGTARLALRNG